MNPLDDDPTPQLVIEVGLPEASLRAALVVDRVGSHGAFGGVRIVPDLRLDELKAGARAMTRKFAFVNVPIGGAKSAIEAPADLNEPERIRLLQGFGRALTPLIRSRTYLPGCDMGTNEADLGTLLQAAGVPLTPDQIDSSRATALTIVESVRQVMSTIGVSLRGDARIALEGLGKVGGHVASMLAADGVRLVAVSTADGALHCDAGLDVARLLALRAAHGSRLVEHYDGAGARRTAHRKLFETECDVLLPGVRSGVIDVDIEPSIRARALVPFSNAGVQPEAERRLTARGVIVFPDFVANCGGIVAVDLRAAGFSRPDDIEHVVRTVYRDAVARALATARHTGESIGDVCRGIEAQNRRALDNATPAAQGLAAAVAAGPAAVVRRLAWRLHKSGALPEPFRHQALHRFLEWRLDVTRGRMVGSTSTSE